MIFVRSTPPEGHRAQDPRCLSESGRRANRAVRVHQPPNRDSRIANAGPSTAHARRLLNPTARFQIGGHFAPPPCSIIPRSWPLEHLVQLREPCCSDRVGRIGISRTSSASDEELRSRATAATSFAALPRRSSAMPAVSSGWGCSKRLMACASGRGQYSRDRLRRWRGSVRREAASPPPAAKPGKPAAPPFVPPPVKPAAQSPAAKRALLRLRNRKRRNQHLEQPDIGSTTTTTIRLRPLRAAPPPLWCRRRLHRNAGRACASPPRLPSAAASGPGSIVWRYPEWLPGQGAALIGFRNCPAADGKGQIYAAVGSIVAGLAEESGGLKTLWEYKAGGHIPGSVALGHDGRLRVHSSDGKLHCVTDIGRGRLDADRRGRTAGLGVAAGRSRQQHLDLRLRAADCSRSIRAASRGTRRSFARGRSSIPPA